MVENKFYVLGNDIIFKNTFNTEERLKRLLSETLELNVKEVYQNDIELQVEKHIQLNLTWNLQKFLPFDVTSRKIIKCYIMDEETHKKVHDDIFEIVHVNMDYFKKVWYHGNIKDENPFFMLLAASNKEEMDKISKGDKFMEEIAKKVKKLNLDPEIVKEIVIENEDEIIKNSIYHSGIKDGISQNKIEIAKNLLKMGMNINDISEATGLSKKEIEDLK